MNLHVVLLVALAVATVPPLAFAQEGAPALLRPAELGESTDIRPPAHFTVGKTDLVRIDLAAFDSGRFTVDLFGDPVTISRDEAVVHEGYTEWFGSGDGVRAAVVIDESGHTGRIHTTSGTYGFQHSGHGDVYFLIEFDHSDLPPDAVDDPSGAGGDSRRNLPAASRQMVDQLEDIYRGGLNYRALGVQDVVIDVSIAWTRAVADLPDRDDPNKNP